MKSQQEQKSPSFVIVGGGLSGLTAARQLLFKHPQAQVTLLEANDYLGGRTKTLNLHGQPWDLGAQFIGPTQHHAIELAIQSQNQLLPVCDKGKKVIGLKEGVFTYNSSIPNIGNYLALIEMQWALFKIDRMASKVPLQNPRDCPLGPQWDSMTAQTWVERNLRATKTRVMLEGAIRTILGAQLSEISFLYLLYYVKQSKSFENIITVQNGLQQKKTLKGTQHMSIFLGQKIKELGGIIKLNFKVIKITQNQNGVKVFSQQGQQIKGDYLVMAMPPPAVGKISFEPVLSFQRRLICERSFMGGLGKLLLFYKEGYWKQRGFSGQVISDCFDAPAMNVFDNTHTNEKGEEKACLVVFLGGQAYHYWKNKQNMEQVLVEKLALFFKQPEMLKPTDIHYQRWEDTPSSGAPVTNFPPGVLSHIEDLRCPEGRIHWAGTEMAQVSTGYMDGAIESGKRVADELSRRVTQQISSKMKLQIQDDVLPYTKINRPSSISWMSRLFEWW